MSWIEAAIRWYAVLAATTWALAPGVRWLCDRMLDRGATITRPLAILHSKGRVLTPAMKKFIEILGMNLSTISEPPASTEA